MIDLKITQNNLIQHLETVIKCIQDIELPTSLKSERVTTSQVKDYNAIKMLAAQLPKYGSHIYWIDVDKPALLSKQFKGRSSPISYKCARDNKNDSSNYVYVGSCTRMKLGDRFMQHFGWGNDQTYSLQLKKWISDDELIFTFNYAEMQDSSVIQYIEDQLHKEMKPMFGKSGENNRIKVSK